MTSPIKYPPKLPQRTYATTLEEQRKQLESDEMLERFAAAREAVSADPHRPVYHYVNPQGKLNDPNGFCICQGRYHLFYQAYPPEDFRQHWGHAVSDDLVYWEDLPLAIYPGIEDKCFSGSALVEEDRVIAFYAGTEAGTMAAVSSDPLLLNWEKLPACPVIPWQEGARQGSPERPGDPCLWREKDGYYALTGGYTDGEIFEDGKLAEYLFHSKNLEEWTYQGLFIEDDRFSAPGEDGAVPYFWPIGDTHILLFASHQRGSQYFLGDYDQKRHRFKPFAHGRFNFNQLRRGGVHAPTATPDGEGGILVIHNINWGKPAEIGEWDHIMSLPRRLTLAVDRTLRIAPVDALTKLRGDHQHLGETRLPANQTVVLDGVGGRELEFIARIDPQDAREVSIEVCRSPNAEETTVLRFLHEGHLQHATFEEPNYDHALVLDAGRASTRPDVLARPPEIAPFRLPEGEDLELHIFIDRSVVEVFANGTQALGLRIYPEREDSIGIAIRAQGRDALLKSLDVWEMKSIW